MRENKVARFASQRHPKCLTVSAQKHPKTCPFLICSNLVLSCSFYFFLHFLHFVLLISFQISHLVLAPPQLGVVEVLRASGGELLHLLQHRTHRRHRRHRTLGYIWIHLVQSGAKHKVQQRVQQMHCNHCSQLSKKKQTLQVLVYLIRTFAACICTSFLFPLTRLVHQAFWGKAHCQWPPTVVLNSRIPAQITWKQAVQYRLWIYVNHGCCPKECTYRTHDHPCLFTHLLNHSHILMSHICLELFFFHLSEDGVELWSWLTRVKGCEEQWRAVKSKLTVEPGKMLPCSWLKRSR